MDVHESRLCIGLSGTYYRILSIGILETDLLPDIKHWDFRNGPAVIRAGHFELHH